MKKDSAIRKCGLDTSAANQEFHKAVGSVAGRDSIDQSEEVHQVSTGDFAVNVNADKVTVVQLNKLLNSLTESTQQANFYAVTGIRCGRPTRLQLEMLMEKHGFHYHELGRAWKTQALVWDGKTAKLRVGTRVFDLSVGWGGLAFSAVMFTVLMLSLLSVPKRVPFTDLMAGMLILGFLGAITYFVRSHLHPQQVAKRVERALAATQIHGSSA